MGLTDLQIRRLSAQGKRYAVSDNNGLYLRVETTGTKFFEYRYVFDGSRKRMTLGGYPGVTLADARKKHAEAVKDVQRGVDPGAVVREARAKRKAAPTFKDMLDELWEMELRHKKSGLQSLNLLEKDAVPVWGRRKIEDIKRRDIVLLLDKIAQRAPVVRNRVHGALSRLFNFAAERGAIEDSPCTRIRKLAESGRDRVLTDEEIKKLWAALDLENKKVDIYKVTKLAIKLILLTGQRPGEVCGMTWDEVEGETFWNIPAERMKNGEPNRVPLCAMARDVLDQAKTFSGDEGPVFRSSYKPEQALTRHALTRSVNRHWSEMGVGEKFTPHDLRRTMRTRLAELGIDDIVAERVLGHKLQGMAAIYNRHAYDTEKRQALSRWETKLAGIIGSDDHRPDNVIRFEGHRG